MSSDQELGVDSVCCLLHNMVPGGSAWQWIHLLERHVEAGGAATIVAPPGPLSATAREAGIELIGIDWNDGPPQGHDALWHIVAGHDAAIVHWDHGVMRAFAPARAACGRAVLAVHQAPNALTRWFGPEIVASARAPLIRAVNDEHAAVLVRGESHRRRVATAFDLPEASLDILPASVPLASIPFQPRNGTPVEVVALMRLSPEKAAVGQLAVALTRTRLAAGHPCRLTIAGDGPWRAEAEALCERELPSGSWQIEVAPADSIARLAAADLVVAQGLTTLEGAALGRPIVVARAVDENNAAGAVLRPNLYELAARDPFGRPPLCDDAAQLWDELLAVDGEQLRRLRTLVENHNSLPVASRALADALAGTHQRTQPKLSR
jgi:hypothetical protein